MVPESDVTRGQRELPPVGTLEGFCLHFIRLSATSVR